ncbi:hypothetical protein MNB_SUP05-SYMBIONT-7-15 [hydrothermal vent metagenome]|uniref:Uncharacterized protein n=1 Tax=hydrothermal vent metagenome TaxID=652676 RepID=A0A1W1E500_9ZZZZ
MLTKVISEQHLVNQKNGGGIIKIEAWENHSRKIVKYSMAYINNTIYSGDNGRVLGYDNAHNFHHKHYFGQIIEIKNFDGFEKQVESFELEMKEFIK